MTTQLRVRRVVLFGTAARVQPHGRAALPHPSRAAPVRAGHHQPPTRGRPPRGLRGGGCRTPQSGARGEHSSREGGGTPRGAVGQLADRGTGAAAAPNGGSAHAARAARPRHTGPAARLWTAPRPSARLGTPVGPTT